MKQQFEIHNMRIACLILEKIYTEMLIDIARVNAMLY